jgi:processive 1,2-diacylglycerol beta-glucosyltransferase
MKRILIFHISQFGGHSKAAYNIKEAILCKEPKVKILNINGFGYFYPLWEKLIDFIYTTVVRHFPFIWGKIYDRKNIVKSLSGFRKIINKKAFKKLNYLIKDFSPHCFVATQAFPCGIVADFKQTFGLRVPLVAVVTDYYPHRFWIHSSVDRYIVACREAKEILIKEGIEEEKIEILGIPISVKFLESHSKKEIADELGFEERMRSILIMGGGWGIGPIIKISQQLDKLEENFQIIIICGKNKKLYNWFKKHKDSFKKPVFYFSYIDFVYKIMDFSDIIITKAGGITVSEALCKDLAIIITHPIPGQEERNVNYLLKEKAILKCDDVKKVKETVNILLKDESKMSFLKEQAKRISSVSSSLKIAELILNLI